MVAIKSLYGGTEAAMQEGANGKEQQKRARAQDAGGRGKFGKVGEVQAHDQVNQPAALAHQMNAGEDGAQDAGEAAPSTRPRKRGLLLLDAGVRPGNGAHDQQLETTHGSGVGGTRAR